MIITRWQALQWTQDFLRLRFSCASMCWWTESLNHECILQYGFNRLHYEWDSGVHLTWMSNASEGLLHASED